MHDFLDKKLGKANADGVYDPAMKEGCVTVGITHDTAEFAVASIENWWEHLGKEKYAAATKLLITIDAGGSNGYRVVSRPTYFWLILEKSEPACLWPRR